MILCFFPCKRLWLPSMCRGGLYQSFVNRSTTPTNNTLACRGKTASMWIFVGAVVKTQWGVLTSTGTFLLINWNSYFGIFFWLPIHSLYCKLYFYEYCQLYFETVIVILIVLKRAHLTCLLHVLITFLCVSFCGFSKLPYRANSWTDIPSRKFDKTALVLR